MTLCPIALAVHCVGCPIVKLCPAKTVLGDYGRYAPPPAAGVSPKAKADEGGPRTKAG